jgi:hypothetical protein
MTRPELPYSSMSLENWKEQVTERRGEYSQRLKSERHTREKESSFLVNWPTPDTCPDAPNSGSNKKNVPKNFAEAINWATPTARECSLWPTPTTAEGAKIASQANYGQVGLSNHPAIVGQPDRVKTKKGGKNHAPGHTEKLNPDWLEQLMGLPSGWTDLGSWATE